MLLGSSRHASALPCGEARVCVSFVSACNGGREGRWPHGWPFCFLFKLMKKSWILRQRWAVQVLFAVVGSFYRSRHRCTAQRWVSILYLFRSSFQLFTSVLDVIKEKQKIKTNTNRGPIKATENGEENGQVDSSPSSRSSLSLWSPTSIGDYLPSLRHRTWSGTLYSFIFILFTVVDVLFVFLSRY